MHVSVDHMDDIFFFFSFLGATKHLYKRVCPSVRLSVTPFDLPSYRGVSEYLMPCSQPCFLLFFPQNVAQISVDLMDDFPVELATFFFFHFLSQNVFSFSFFSFFFRILFNNVVVVAVLLFCAGLG